jgi:hypothetical protein
MRRSLHLGGVAWLVLASVAALALCGSVAAAAEEPTRAAYVETLEGICRPDAEATQGAMRGARSDLQHERIAVAAVKFGKAASIFGGTVKKIAAVPRPPADASRLGKWFTFLNRQESYLGRITGDLRAGKSIKAQRLTARFIHSGNLANNVVIAFGFNYCSFKFSRYG